MSDVDIDALIRGPRPRRRWLVPVAAAVLVAAGIGAFFLLRADEPVVVVEPEQVEATAGRLSTTVSLSGTAVAERSADLGFGTEGTVASVAVGSGQAVRAGDMLAALDDADGRRRIETAEVQLRLARLRLDDLLASAAASEVASARQSIESAESQVTNAEQELARLSEPPSASELATAEQAVANALGQLSSAEETLTALSEPPSASELATAEQAVANALGQLSSAEETLTALSEPPSASELATAEQAVANALGQLSSAEETLTALSEPPSASELATAEQAVANALGQLSDAEETLTELRDGPSEAEVASARSEVTLARAQLSGALNDANDSLAALEEAFDVYCTLYGDIDVAEVTCANPVPLDDRKVERVHNSLEDRSAAYQERATRLISTNAAFLLADAAREGAVTEVTTAEERLESLLAEVSEEDLRQAELALEAARANHTAATARLDELLEEPTTQDFYQAQQAVEAARANHAAATARLDELLEEPTTQDFYQAQQAVEAARANHAAATARLDELLEEPTTQDFYQAQQAVEAARANHAAATARLDELRAPPDESDLMQAQAALDTALATLASAQASYEELLAGATANAIAQQEQNVRLAEISLEETRVAMADLSVVAPFDGVVEAVNVHPGDRVTQNTVAFSLATPDRMLIDLTVTEADLLALEVDQAGLASFDGVEGVEYPVRIVSISRMPNAEQGVVTYGVEARILTGAEIAEVASRLAVLATDGAAAGFGGVLEALAGGGEGGPGFGGGFGGNFGGGGAGGPGGPFAGFELPEGVTIRDVIRAVINGDPLPEGVTLPEGFEIPQQVIDRLASGGLDAPGPQGGTAGPGASAARLLPAPGMSADVTILTEVREQSVLAPISAVRQLDGEWFVTVPAAAGGDAGAGFERVTVEVGESDGVNVEITGGLEAGAVLLIGADSAGIAYSATRLQQPQPAFGFPQGPPGGFGGGGGGGRP